MNCRIARPRVWFVLTVAVFCMTLLSLLPAAAAEKTGAFMGEVFYGSNGAVLTVSDDRIVLPMGEDGQSIGYFTAVAPAAYDTPNNAIRFVITNYSASNYFHLRYSYATEEGDVKTETQRIDIGAYNGRCTYVVRIPEVDRLKSITLTLPARSGSSLVLHAMEAVRVWAPTESLHGKVSACTYNSTSKTVTVKGSIYHDIMIAAGNGTLGLYRLEPGQTVEQLLHDQDAEPLVTSSLSIGFQLQASAGDAAARCARYAVLIHLPDGTRLPLGNARYAASESSFHQMTSRQDFKGIDTTMISGAIDSNVGSAIVDVYLNRLENDKPSGYLYTVEGKSFYFNRAYLADLDATVRSLSGAACRVYLRFLVESTVNDDIIQDGITTVEGEDSRYSALRVDAADSLMSLYAYTTFLCSHYRGEGQGEIAGLILGTRVDQASEFNSSGLLTLSEYTVLYGRTLSVLTIAARDVNPSLKIVIPVSDGWNAPAIGTAHRRDDYTAELFLESLAAYLSAHGAGQVTAMIESTHNPYGLNDAYFEPVNTDGEQGPIPEELIPKLTPATNESYYLSSENIALLDNYLRTYSSRYSVLSDRYLFHWTPDGETSGNALSASYVYHYYRLFSDTRAEGFFVSFREKELAGDRSKFSKIKYLVKYIDTSSGSLRTKFALDIFESESWSTLIPNFNREAIEQISLVESVFSTYSDEHLTGSYPLFDFNTANSTRGWYAGNNCLALSVAGSEKYGKTLDAVMLADLSTLAEYSDIAYSFENPLPLRFSPYLSMTVAVDCQDDPDAVFEIKLVLGSNEGYLEAKQVVKNGEIATVALDTAQFAESSEITYLRLSAKTVMGESETFTIHLRSLTLDSREYDSNALAALIGEWMRVDSGRRYNTSVQERNPMLLIILGGAVLFGTLIVALTLHHYQKVEEDEDET